MNALLNRILLSPAHPIAAVRTKAEPVLADKTEPQLPKKAGKHGVQQDGPDHESDLDRAPQPATGNDRNRSFTDRPCYRPGHYVGQDLQPEC